MKKILYMAVAAVAALSSCSSEEFAGSNGNNGDGSTFTATIESDVTSRSTLDATSKKPLWETTDIVSINGVKYQAQTGGVSSTILRKVSSETAATPDATYHAFFAEGANTGTGSWDATNKTFSLPASYTYAADKFNMPMYAQSETTSLSFKNLCGVLAVTVTSAEMKKVTSITVTSDKQLNGAFTATAEGVMTFKSKTLTDEDKTITLNCGEGVVPADAGTIFYIPLPALTSATLYVTVKGDISDAKATEYKNLIYTQSMKATGVTIESNKIYSATFATSLASFSVGANSKVNFTKSNIYYDGSALQFETNQTDYPTEWSTSHVGHFYWNSTLESSVAETYTATGNSTYFESKVTVDGTSDLRILTGYNGEYKYLFNTRTNASSLYKYGVTVGSVTNCLIIAPDNFVGTLKSSYTLDELKAYGLVCLPAAGHRGGSTLDDGGSNGSCWSATLELQSYHGNCAFNLYFNNNYLDPTDYSYRNTGRSIRLVQKEETTTPTLTIDDGTYGF